MNCKGEIYKNGFRTICSKPIFRCERCGATGCENKECKNQKFSNGRCTICGGVVKRGVV